MSHLVPRDCTPERNAAIWAAFIASYPMPMVWAACPRCPRPKPATASKSRPKKGQR